MIVGSQVRLEIGSICHIRLHTNNGDYAEQPFFVVREATVEEYVEDVFANHERAFSNLGSEDSRESLAQVYRFHYEVRTD